MEFKMYQSGRVCMYFLSKFCRFVFSGFFVFQLSCSSNDTSQNIKLISEFPIVSELSGSSITFGSANFNPLLLGLKDSILVVCDIENSPHFHLYQVPDFHYIGSFGQQGRGPFEFENPLFWGQFKNTEQSKIWVYEMNRLTISLIDLYKALHLDQYTPDKIISLPPQAYNANNILVLNDSTLLGSGLFDQNEFMIYCRIEEQVNWISYNSNYTNGIQRFLERNSSFYDVLKQGVVKGQPERLRFVKSHVYFPILDVYDFDGELDFTIQLNKTKVLPVFDEGKLNPKTKVWYENVFLTERYIYALNRNCNIKQYFSDECNNAEIHVFDWQGQPVIKYKLNEGIAPASPFVVDEKHQKIYTVNFKNSDDFFRVFDTGKNTHQ